MTYALVPWIACVVSSEARAVPEWHEIFFHFKRVIEKRIKIAMLGIQVNPIQGWVGNAAMFHRMLNNASFFESWGEIYRASSLSIVDFEDEEMREFRLSCGSTGPGRTRWFKAVRKLRDAWAYISTQK